MKKKRMVLTAAMCIAAILTAGCQNSANTGNLPEESKEPVEATLTPTPEPTDKPSDNQNTEDEKKDEGEKVEEVKKVNYARLFNDLTRGESYKGLKYNNPLITQEFGADPYAMVYNDTVYIYMTQDAYEMAGNTIKENSYSQIRSIRVISSKDMVNWTDHGAINVANGKAGALWAHNSWAPAACWKNIDGKDQFFLYFADSARGIGVLQADSPIGPFYDPIGTALITRETPNCADVYWLFDPAVLVDDDGRAYLYFGGGVPEGKTSHPMTARCVELGADMISIQGEPVTIDAPYLFEDSGIHKYNNKYYYTYCTNWNVDGAGTDEYGFHNAEIACMESDSPLGPFTYKETILENPGKYFKLYGNNHHCVFSFKGDWYITYHTRALEKEMGVEKGYRSTFINKFTMQPDGSIGYITQNFDGCEALCNMDPYEKTNACTFSHESGIAVNPVDPKTAESGSGEMVLTGIDSGDFIKISNLDFSYKEANKLTMTVKKTRDIDETCAIEVRVDSMKGDVIAYVPVGELLKDVNRFQFSEISVDLKKSVDGVHNIYMTFSGSSYEIRDWQFSGVENNWYEEMLQTSLLSTGTNGRLEKVLEKLANGEDVKIGFIGGSVTEGAGAAKITESYADQVVTNLKAKYPSANISYVNAGLGGTPSALGIMRYERDIVDAFGGTPDLLFIEFSVNDYQEATDGRAFESLVRTALESSEDTAVALVFAVFKSKWNMQDVYIPMGDLYGLPMISIKDATKKPFENGKLTDEKFFSDEYHPTSYGHTIMADCICYVLNEAAAKEVPEKAGEVPESTVRGNDFQGSVLVTAKEANGAVITAGGFASTDTAVHAFMRGGKIAFPDNWKHTKDSAGDAFEMKLTCKTLLINFKQSGNADTAGAVEVLVDGNVVKEINSFAQGGWNQSIVDLIIDEKEAKEHTVTIRMKAGDENKEFTLLAFAYTK